MKKNKELIIRIIADYILWSRISKGMLVIVNALGNKGNLNIDFEPDYKYNGFTNAFYILNINNDVLQDELSSICVKTIMDVNNNNSHYIELAANIYQEWIIKIAEYAIKAA